MDSWSVAAAISPASLPAYAAVSSRWAAFSSACAARISDCRRATRHRGERRFRGGDFRLRLSQRILGEVELFEHRLRRGRRGIAHTAEQLGHRVRGVLVVAAVDRSGIDAEPAERHLQLEHIGAVRARSERAVCRKLAREREHRPAGDFQQYVALHDVRAYRRDPSGDHRRRLELARLHPHFRCARELGVATRHDVAAERSALHRHRDRRRGGRSRPARPRRPVRRRAGRPGSRAVSTRVRSPQHRRRPDDEIAPLNRRARRARRGSVRARRGWPR